MRAKNEVVQMNDKLGAILSEVAANIHYSIQACNRPDQKNNYELTTLVYIAQQKCDEILANEGLSVLLRIHQCAKLIRELKAGNCMLQAFVAFDDILKRLVIDELITVNQGIDIAIKTNATHAFILVEDIVCDPWSNFVGSLDDYHKTGWATSKLGNYFCIRANWGCFSDSQYDANSTQDTFLLFDANKPAESYASARFFPSTHTPLLEGKRLSSLVRPTLEEQPGEDKQVNKKCF